VAAAVGQSNQTVGVYASSNTYLTSSGTVDARSLSFRGDKSITVGISASEVVFSVGAYLTTAALSQDSSKYAGTSTGMTGGSVTLNTSGIAINLPAYLTTAALSGDTSKYAGVGETVGTIAGSDLGLTVNTDGVSIGYPKWLTTAQAPGAYLTTAALSQDSSKYAGINSGATNCSVTVNTSGVSVNLPAYLTTAALSADSSKYAGTSTGITGGSVTLNTSGIAINLPAYLTTAALSADSSKYAGINSGATNCSVTVNTSGVSVNLPAYLTTAALSADSSKYAGTSTGITGGSVTLNTSGIAINLPAYLTTAALSADSSKYAGVNSGATNCAVTVNTSGVSVSLPYISYVNLAPFWFNTVTSSLAGSTSYMIPFVAPQPMSIGSIRMFEVGSVAASSTEGLVNGSTLSMGGFTSHNFVFYSRGTGASSASLQYVTSTQVADQVSMNVANAAGANSSNVSYTLRFSLGNTSFTKDYSSTAQSYNFHTSNITDLTGTKQVDYPCGLTLSAGQWFLAYGRSSTTSTQNAVISVATRLNISYDSQFVVTQNTLGALGTLGGASNSSVVFGPTGLGSFSTGGAAGTTNSLNHSVISSGSSNQVPLLQLLRIA